VSGILKFPDPVFPDRKNPVVSAGPTMSPI